MTVYSLKYTQTIPASIDDAWNFFSRPENLCRITPEWLCFENRSQQAEQMHAGMIIQYTIRPVAGIPMGWTTEITHVRKPYYFVDEQRLGPYRFWHHQHLFKETDQGTQITDLIHYALHLGPLAAPLHLLVVRPKLEEIFSFRKNALRKIF